MTQLPSLSAHRRLARKLPRPIRRAFVRAVDSLAWRERKPGRHHVGGAK
jgi:hypothetical protein